VAKKKIKNSFEDDLKRLEEISDLLENEDYGLDDSITLFEEGIKLSKLCISNLKNAELKISKLKADLTETPFQMDQIQED